MAKKTHKKANISNSKKTVINAGYSSDKEKVIWCFDKIDRSGKFAFDSNRPEFQHKLILDKIIDYSSMTWSDIKKQTHDDGKSKHHMLSLDSLSDDAVERIKAKHLEEYSDSIFSFALQNKLRIIGIRQNSYFHVIWYDSNHEIYPSNKKNT